MAHSSACPPCQLPPSSLQAKLSELHKQIDELTGKVSGLQTENAALHSRTSILEKVLDMRNEQIQVMQEKKEVRVREHARMRVVSRLACLLEMRVMTAHIASRSCTCCCTCLLPSQRSSI